MVTLREEFSPGVPGSDAGPDCDEAGDPWVYADPQRLRQILLNILSNAVKYNREGGWVAFEACRGSDGAVELRVTDGGPGIAPKMLPGLFAPFERLGAANTAIEGTGLGLAVSKRLAEAMGGGIHVQSELGQGTSFFLRLPGTAPSEAPDASSSVTVAEPNGSQHPAAVRARTVLYIEDNMANALLMEHIASALPNLRLIVAETAARGLVEARRERPDVILLDLNLPDGHGLSIVDGLRTACPGSALAIVSADATSEQIERAQAAGIATYFTKPISLADITDFLAHAA
jgi:CheY-like chemotaxis protein